MHALPFEKFGGPGVLQWGEQPDPVDPRLLMDRSLTLTGGDLWNVLPKLLGDGARAHAYLESREAVGKVLLRL